MRRSGIVVVFCILALSAFAVCACRAAAQETVAGAALAQEQWVLRIEQKDAWTDIEDAVVDVLGQPFVVLRLLTGGIGANLSWIEATKEAIFTSDRTVAVLQANSRCAYVNGEAVTLSAPPDAQSGRIAVAVSDLSVFGLKAAIDAQSRVIRVSWPRSRVTSASASVDHGSVAVVIEADASFRFSDFVLRSPDRLVIDVFDSVLEPSVSTIEVGEEAVARVRAAMNRPGVVRVVVDLAAPLGYTLEYAGGAPARLAVRFNTQITGFELDATALVPRLLVSTTGRSAISPPQVDSNGVALIDFPGASIASPQAEVLPESGPVKSVRSSALDDGGTRVFVELSDGYRAVVRESLCDDEKAVIDFALAIRSIKWREEPGCTVVDIMTSGPVDANPFRLKDPSRLAVDLPGVRAAGIPASVVQSPSVEQIRVAQFTEDTARVVLDLKEAWAHAWEVLPGNMGVRLKVGTSPVFGRTIMIDPGHGGTDPGAVYDGVFEKDLNLDMALRLRQLLSESGARAVMTRDSDVSVELCDRSRMANELMPDVFISVHCNSTKWDVFPSGTETYYCSAVPYSQELAALTHTCVLRELKLMDRHVRRGDYHVVRETRAPAVLVEVAFMSNGTDLKKLRDPEFRQKAAVGMFDGLSMYLGSEMFRKWRAEIAGRAEGWWYVGDDDRTGQ